MAKKRVKKKKAASTRIKSAPHVRNPRKEPYDSERLQQVVERLRDQAARLSALARHMDEDDLDEVIVDGHAMLIRGLNQVDNFADNATRAVREARTALQQT